MEKSSNKNIRTAKKISKGLVKSYINKAKSLGKTYKCQSK